MAERRMFAKTIVLSDAFLDLPMTARCLYFTLGMLADDDGFVNSPKAIIRQCGASEDDMRMLLAKKFLLWFETGVIVIKHWRINNYLRNDRYSETKYVDEKQMLNIEPNGAYRMKNSGMIPAINDNGIPSMGIPSIDKDRLDKNSLEEDTPKRKRFTPPTVEEVRQYCQERKNGIDAEHFIDYYATRGWELKHGQKVRDWKACIRTWERNNFSKGRKNPAGDFAQRDYSGVNDEIMSDLAAEIKANRDAG